MNKPELKWEGTQVTATWSEQFSLDTNGDGQPIVTFETSNKVKIDLTEIPDEVLSAVNKAKGK